GKPGKAGENEQGHDRDEGEPAARVALHHMPDDDSQREPEEDHRHELHRLLVVLKQDELGRGAEEAEHQNGKDPAPQALDGGRARGSLLRVHGMLRYRWPRASFATSAKAAL